MFFSLGFFHPGFQVSVVREQANCGEEDRLGHFVPGSQGRCTETFKKHNFVKRLVIYSLSYVAEICRGML